MSFNGSLVQINGEEFPWQYIVAESYKVTPKRIQDLDPYRTESGWLIRNPVDHEPSTISFDTRKLDNTQLKDMMNFITSKYTNAKERKLHLVYYNPITDDYSTGDFYLNSNLEYTIRQIDVKNKKIFYNEFTLDFVEY